MLQIFRSPCRRWRFGFTALLFLFCFAATFCFRGLIARQDMAKLNRAAGGLATPFLVESAIMYSYINQVADGKPIAGYDPQLVGAERYQVSEQMSLGLEYTLGYAVKLRRWLAGNPPPAETAFEDNPAETAFMRCCLLGWIALIPGLIFLWLLACRCPWPWALTGALVNIVAPAAVARYTGQDLLQGPFAMPVIVGWFAVMAAGSRRQRSGYPILAAILAFLAVSLWDAGQFLLGLWGVAEVARLLLGGIPSARRRNMLLVSEIGMVNAALFMPYNIAHGFLLSPVILGIYPVAILANLLPWRPGGYRRRAAAILLAVAATVAIWYGLSQHSEFGGSYRHFQDLAWAKLKFHNVKPADPALLNFDQRFLWTPELHSATWSIVRTFFPGILFGGVLLTILLAGWRRGRRQLRRVAPQFLPLALLAVVTFLFFIFFVRFHVFAALFLSAALPFLLLAAWRTLRRHWSRALLILAVLAGLYWEGAASFSGRRQYPPDIGELCQLISYLRRFDCRNQVILANLDVSSLLKGYCGARIIVQPKFELETVRGNIKDYIELLFNAPEEQFAAFCADHQVSLMIFATGMALEDPHIYSYRYMSGSLRINPASTAAMMEAEPKYLKHFVELELPPELQSLKRYFKLFKFIPPGAARRSDELAELANNYRRAGNPATAQRLAFQSYLLAPNNDNAYLACFQAYDAAPPPAPDLEYYLPPRRPPRSP